MLSCYASFEGGLSSASKIFDEMDVGGSVSWTALIDGYVKNDRPEDAIRFFKQMRLESVEIDEVAVSTALTAAGMARDISFGRCIHGFFVECLRVRWDLHLGTSLLTLYAKCGDYKDAQKVFDKMPIRNLICWSALLSCFVRCQRSKDVLTAFYNMIHEGISPNHVTLSVYLKAAADLGALNHGRWAHNYMTKTGIKLNYVTGSSLIGMYAKCGHAHDALSVFKELPLECKDVYSWTSLINGLATNGLARECLDLFSEMKKLQGVIPNEITFLAVLGACSHAGLVEKAMAFFDSMVRDYKIKPFIQHYGCMVDLLGKAGRFEEALKLISSMPMKPSAGVWGALQGGCIIHKEYKLGEAIGKYLVGLQPNHSGRISLLANSYSFSHEWMETAKLRMGMRASSSFRKVIGCSWVEIESAVHEFVSSDTSHPCSRDIYEMLNGLMKQIRSKM